MGAVPSVLLVTFNKSASHGGLTDLERKKHTFVQGVNSSYVLRWTGLGTRAGPCPTTSYNLNRGFWLGLGHLPPLRTTAGHNGYWYLQESRHIRTSHKRPRSGAEKRTTQKKEVSCYVDSFASILARQVSMPLRGIFIKHLVRYISYLQRKWWRSVVKDYKVCIQEHFLEDGANPVSEGTVTIT